MIVLRNLTCALVVGAALGGCARSESAAPPNASADGEATGHTHGGWWCNEHGVPEEVCTLCDARLVAGFKAKGDWCKTHERPDSQCFVCHPEREAEFAAQYEAKYGKQPPKPDHAPGHEHHEGSEERS